MKTLDHIESPKSSYDHPLFLTVTLPKSMNRKGPARQKQYMDNYLKHITENFLVDMVGAYEFTKIGNLHAHVVATPRDDLFPKIVFDTKEERMKASAQYLSARMKRHSIIDVQLVKNIENVYNYIMKETKITCQILESSPFIRIYQQAEKFHPLKMEPLVIDSDGLDYEIKSINNEFIKEKIKYYSKLYAAKEK